MIFADGIEQAHLAAVLEHGCMHFSQVHIDAVPVQLLHQALETSVLVTSISSQALESRITARGGDCHFGDHGFHTVPDGECVGIVQLPIDAHDQHPRHGVFSGCRPRSE